MRLFLILAAVFFIIWAVLIGNIFVDAVVYNSVFVIINLTYSIILIKKRYFKVALDPLEERIYQKDFKRVMDRLAFRNFMRSGYLRTYNEGGQIIHQGNNFSSVFYVATIHPKYKVTYYKNDKEYLSVKENAWIGVVEYSMMEKEDKKIANVKINNPNGVVYTNKINHNNIIANYHSHGNKNLNYPPQHVNCDNVCDLHKELIGQDQNINDNPLKQNNTTIVNDPNNDNTSSNLKNNNAIIVMDHRGYNEVQNVFRKLFFMGTKEREDIRVSGIKRKLNKQDKIREEKKKIMKSLSSKITWGLSASVSRIEEDVDIDDEFYEDCEDPVYIYEFSIRVK